MQSMMRIAEESIPRSAENIALALGALCAVRTFFFSEIILDMLIQDVYLTCLFIFWEGESKIVQECGSLNCWLVRMGILLVPISESCQMIVSVNWNPIST